MLKLYVVVRDDLVPAQQAVQAMHALADFSSEWPEQFQAWQADNNTLVLLSAKPSQIEYLEAAAVDGQFAHTVFVEPDELQVSDSYYGREADLKTAIAFAPNWYVQYGLLKGYPLALPSRVSEYDDGVSAGFRKGEYEGRAAVKLELERLAMLSKRELKKLKRS